jgi:hypothetical protein
MAFDTAHPQLASDHAPDRRETSLATGSGVGLLRTLEDQQASERETREHSELARAVPGYFRL